MRLPGEPEVTSFFGDSHGTLDLQHSRLSTSLDAVVESSAFALSALELCEFQTCHPCRQPRIPSLLWRMAILKSGFGGTHSMVSGRKSGCSVNDWKETHFKQSGFPNLDTKKKAIIQFIQQSVSAEETIQGPGFGIFLT